MIGPLALHILLDSHLVNSSLHPTKLRNIPGAMEYPPGFLLLPLRSSTLPPFKTTTLVTYAPASAYQVTEQGAKIEVIEADAKGGSKGPEPEPPVEKASDGASQSGTGGVETGEEAQGASTSKTSKRKEKASSQSEIQEESQPGGSGRSHFDPLRKLPSPAREKRAQQVERLRQEKAESLRRAGEMRHGGAKIKGTCLLVDPGGKTDSEGRTQVKDTDALYVPRS